MSQTLRVTRPYILTVSRARGVREGQHGADHLPVAVQMPRRQADQGG